jgi:hypothetical protein
MTARTTAASPLAADGGQARKRMVTSVLVKKNEVLCQQWLAAADREEK